MSPAFTARHLPTARLEHESLLDRLIRFALRRLRDDATSLPRGLSTSHFSTEWSVLF